MDAKPFDYTNAFSRNIGWVTPDEQAVLRAKRVAIAGLGGVGGSHLLTLTRLGIGSFTIADFDTFALENFNRQAGARLSTIGRQKTEVLAESALDINPELDLRILKDGINKQNVSGFLDDADIYVDGLDFFAVAARRLVFAACHERGIPAVTAAPLGMGAALLNFIPGGMTFEEYFRLDGQSEMEQLLRFYLGLSPAVVHKRSLVDPSTIALAKHRGPSTAVGCELCAGIVSTEVLKLLLGRGKVTAAPRGLHFDAYQNRLVRTWRPGGNRNPLQRLGLFIARRRLGIKTEPYAAMQAGASGQDTPVLDILDLARWAPSGDNAQPWRFEITDEQHAVIHGNDTRDHCVYDLHGRASQLAIGCLRETISIAASAHGLRADFSRRQGIPDHTPTIDVTFIEDPAVQTDALLPCITKRTVNRRRLSTRPLTKEERSQFEQALGPGYSVLWYGSFRDRLKLARLMFRNGGLRLNLPEAYETHRSIIDWNSHVSEERIPDRAVGLDPLSRHLMRWALGSWSRAAFLNKYLGGSLIPRLELDFIPSMGCAAHFMIMADNPLTTIDDYLNAGKAVQRFWLTGTQLNLSLQPEMTPLIFNSYIREDVRFTRHKPSFQLAQDLSAQLADIISPAMTEHGVFMGRVGEGSMPSSRSVRLPLRDLLIDTADSDEIKAAS